MQVIFRHSAKKGYLCGLNHANRSSAVKKLHKLIIKSYVGPLLLTFFIAMFILLMQFLWRKIDDLLGKGLETADFVEIMLYAGATMVPLALPLAILVASLMTLGNFGEHYELQAMKSAGISLYRILFPLILITTLLSCGAFFFANNVLPYTNLKLTNLLYSVRERKPEFLLKEGIFTTLSDGFSIKVAEKNPQTGLLQRVMIYDHSDEKGNISVTYADSGYIRTTADKKFLVATLFNGHSYKEVIPENSRLNAPNGNLPAQRQTFDIQKLTFEMQGMGLKRTDEELFKNNYQMLNIKQLDKARDSLSDEYGRRIKYFAHMFSSNNLMHLSLRPEADSIKPTMRFNLDSVFAAQPLNQKQVTIERALATARTAKSFINASIDEFKYKRRIIARHGIEWHRKFSLSFACLVFFLIGAPLGAIICKGGLGMPMLVSVLFFVVYYVITITGEKFAVELIWTPSMGMWLSTMVLFALGLFLSYKATTDASVMNADTYREFFRKIGRFFVRIAQFFTRNKPQSTPTLGR